MGAKKKWGGRESRGYPFSLAAGGGVEDRGREWWKKAEAEAKGWREWRKTAEAEAKGWREWRRASEEAQAALIALIERESVAPGRRIALSFAAPVHHPLREHTR